MYRIPVCVVFSNTPEGLSSARFAADLSLRVGDGRLTVFLQELEATAPLRSVDESPDRLQASRVLELLRVRSGPDVGQLAVTPFLGQTPPLLPGNLLVAPLLPQRWAPAHVLVCFDEETLADRGEGPLVLPFGDDSSGLNAAELAIPLALKLGRRLVLYHTTWRDPSVVSDVPAEHMCPAAVSVRRKLEELVRAAGVPFETVIETADDVTEGIIRCAMRHQSNLIVMSRGSKTGLGSYVKHTLEQSPVPVLVVHHG